MKHLYFKHFFLCFCLLASINSFAYDALINGIYYNLSGTNAEVTYLDKSYNSYSGSVNIPASVTYGGTTYNVTSIGNNAFYNCKNLTSVVFPACLTNIGNYAFQGCVNLSSISFPDGLTSIGTDAFYNCSSLPSLTIPSSVTSINHFTFRGCTSVTSITVASGNPKYDSRNNCNAIIETATNTLITGCQATVIPASVTKIDGWSFCFCSTLTSIAIPNSVTTIGDYAFCDCSSLTSVTIPNSVTTIASNAFNGCKSLTSITLPNSVTSMGTYMFMNCSKLSSITMPNNITKIADWTFYGCSSLTSFDIAESVTSIGSGAFYNCSNLVSLNIPEGVTSIGSSAFSHCSSLASINIPGNITTISDNTFYDCSSLTSINIPEGVTSIGKYAFRHCVGLTDVYCYAENVPITGSDVFYDTPISSATLHVPAASLEQYQTTAPWSGFGTIIGLEDDVPPQPQRQYRYYNLVITGVQESDRMLQFSEFDILDNTFNEVEDLTVYAGTEGSEEDESWPNVADNDVHTKFCGDLNGYAYFMFDAQNSIEPYGYRFYTADDSSLYLGRNPSSWKLYGSNTKLTDPNSTDWVLIDERNNDMTLPSIDYAPNEFYFKDTPNQLNLSQHSATLVSGEELQLQVRDKLNAIQDMTLQWTSTNQSVATVNNQGLVVAKGIGTTDIIVSSAEDSSVRDTCTVTVVASLPGYRYYQFAIEAIGGGDIVQLSEFDLIDENGNEVSPLITYAYTGSSFDGESQENLFDNDIETKYCGEFSSETPVYIFIDAGRHIIPSGYRMVTGGDANHYPERNPVSWSLLGSNSKSSQPNDTVWTLLAHRENDNSLGAEALATYDFVITPGEEPDQQCAKPTISYSNGRLTFNCETEDVTFLSTITDADISSYSSSEVQLGVTYNISVYAKKAGYKDSEVTTATLCWTGLSPLTEGVEKNGEPELGYDGMAKVIINLSNNQTAEYYVSQVDSITFVEGDEIIDDTHGITGGHMWVDLGLPSGTLWATQNVGAGTYGYYYAWGETQPKEYYSCDNYKYGDGSFMTMTKYCTDISFGMIDNKAELEPTDDAATQNWGPNWQTPSTNQLEELINVNYTTQIWTTQNGVRGWLITSRSNNNIIFLPVTGYYNESGLTSSDSWGYYWSRSLNLSNCNSSSLMSFSSAGFGVVSGYRFYARTVRPVRKQ